MRVEIEGLGDARAGLSRGQGVQARRQFALRRLGETAEQLRRDDQPEHAVAQKLEPLIIARTAAAMGQRFAIEGKVAGPGAGQLGDRLRRAAVLKKPSPMRDRRSEL